MWVNHARRRGEREVDLGRPHRGRSVQNDELHSGEFFIGLLIQKVAICQIAKIAKPISVVLIPSAFE
jgi:hypothetical protein